MPTLQQEQQEQQQNKKPDRFDKSIAKFRAKGFDTVVDFLKTKSRKSKKTAVVYSLPLEYLNAFIAETFKGYDIQTVFTMLNGGYDVYKLLNSFVAYLQNNTANGADLTPTTISNYMVAVRSYFQYNDVDISPAKFKHKITMPPIYRVDEQAIDSTDIKEILNRCSNRRLKSYLLVLASGGMRAVEALAIRESDINFSMINLNDPADRVNPAGIRIRKEYAKTRTERHIFISNEAARYLHEYIEYKYRNRKAENRKFVNRVRSPDSLVFATTNNKDPNTIYFKVLFEFQKLMKNTSAATGLDGRKEDGVFKRRKVTFHSFRRFVKTTIANQTRNSDYSEWFLGHKKSPYYTNKPDELRRILEFLDYPTLEATGKSFEARFKQLEKENMQLRANLQEVKAEKEASINTNTIGMADLFKTVEHLQKELAKLKANQKK